MVRMVFIVVMEMMQIVIRMTSMFRFRSIRDTLYHDNESGTIFMIVLICMAGQYVF